jgi:VWFA-related protein
MFHRAVILPALVVVAAIAVADARSIPGTSAAQADARERVLYVSVLDKDGQPVADLKPDEFIIREDNARREVLRVSRATEPMALPILVDNSAAAENDIRNVRDGLTKFVQTMREHGDVALIGLADRPTILQDYTRNFELLKAGIGRLFAQPGSGMMLLDAIVDVSKGAAKREEPRINAVAVLTDGTEFSNLHYNQVLEPLKASGVSLNIVAIGTFGATSDEPRRNRAQVLDLGPKQSGGVHETLLSSMSVGRTLEKLAHDLTNQYKVVYSRPESIIPPETVTVAVSRAGLTARGTPERRSSPPESRRAKPGA